MGPKPTDVAPPAGGSAGRSDPPPLLIRPIAPEDKQALLAAFERLGPESRRQRFLAPHLRLTPRELRYLTEVDHHDHEALVGIDPDTGQVVGVARYARSKHDLRDAELAVTVVDDRQRRGVGGKLASALAERALQEGIMTLTVLVFADNVVMMNLLGELGPVRVVHHEHGVIEATADLED